MATTMYTLTQAAGTSTKKFTVSMWLKPGTISTNRGLWGCGTGTGDGVSMHYQTGDTLSLQTWDGSSNPQLKPTRVFRDPAAWYHLVFSIDTTNASATERLKIYINGVEETVFTTDTTIGENTDIPGWSGSGDTMKIGNRILDGDAFYTGLMSHVHIVDGTIYGASTFGETDSTSGIWKIKTSPTVTYGTNGGFYKFESGALTTDSSGEGNTLTQVGSPTETKDNPSNNFCTMNPLDNYYAASTFTNGNTTVQTASSPYCFNTATMGLSAGLWYWEVKIAADSSTGNEFQNGISDTTPTGTTVQLGDTANAYDYKCANGKIKNNGTEYAYGTTSAVGDILGMYLDLTANKFYVAKNGVVMNSGTGYSINAISSTSGFYNPAYNFGNGSQQGTCNFNFGNGYFGTTVVTSGVADAGGEGTFEYDPSAGTFDSASKDFRAICTKNIKAYG